MLVSSMGYTFLTPQHPLGRPPGCAITVTLFIEISPMQTCRPFQEKSLTSNLGVVRDSDATLVVVGLHGDLPSAPGPVSVARARQRCAFSFLYVSFKPGACSRF